MELEFADAVFEWRGPAPHHFVAVPEVEAGMLEAVSEMVTYGWGMIPVTVELGATIGAVIVTAIAFAEDPKIGIACVIFYVIYQQAENYLIYPRVMSKSVDVPGAVTVIAALVGAALLGVVGALLAIPVAAAILMLTREVFVRRQDQR